MIETTKDAGLPPVYYDTTDKPTAKKTKTCMLTAKQRTKFNFRLNKIDRRTMRMKKVGQSKQLYANKLKHKKDVKSKFFP